jgi:hypothetical protein
MYYDTDSDLLEHALNGRNAILINYLINKGINIPILSDGISFCNKLVNEKIYNKIGGETLKNNIYLNVYSLKDDKKIILFITT